MRPATSRFRELMQSGAILQSDAPLRTMFTVEPARMMRAPGYEWEHEIRVALPPTYAHTDETYPVLWATDNALEIVLPAAQQLAYAGLELIIVSVGATADVSPSERQNRRAFDFSPWEHHTFGGPQGEAAKAGSKDLWPDGLPAGG